MTTSPSTPAGSPLRKALLFLLLPVLAVAGGWDAFRYAKFHLALSHARVEYAHRQFMRAEFWAGRALTVDPTDLPAMRLMADIEDAQDKPAALTWRVQIARRQPGDTAAILAWAKSALRFGQGEMALNALKSLPPDFQNHSADYQELMGGCALDAHEAGLAEVHFLAAAQLDPHNPAREVNLASFRLAHSTSPQVRAAAARELEALLPIPGVSLFAARALLADAIRSNDRLRAQRFAAALRSLPEHNFNDDLACLEAAIPTPAFHFMLAGLESRAQSDPLLATQTGDWLNTARMPDETLRWFATLPAPVQQNIRVQMTASEAYLATSDWTGLQAFLAKCHWPGFEFLKQAMLIRCQRELSHPWQDDWTQLAAQAQANPPESLLLAQLIIGWNWRPQTLDLLWGGTADPRTDSKALQYLWDLYAQTGDTVELLRVARAQLGLDPSNPAKKNNYAFLSLLLFGSSEYAFHLAQEASTANPNVAEWAATYAYALHLAGNDSRAAQVMGALPAEALQRPGIALYYAIVLAANGNTPKARQSLANLNPAGMLPEEQKLAAALAQQLNAASRWNHPSSIINLSSAPPPSAQKTVQQASPAPSHRSHTPPANISAATPSQTPGR